MRPHVLGIDDGPFRKGQRAPVPIVGVMMEGADLVEGVAVGAFPVDGEGVTDYLAAWIRAQRWRPSLQAVIFGGVTIAGLGLIDARALSEALDLPVLLVTRRDTRASTLDRALRAAGLAARLDVLARTPPARRVGPGLYVAAAGADDATADALVHATLGKARLPEPLRLAHLIATALVRGASQGRV